MSKNNDKNEVTEELTETPETVQAKTVPETITAAEPVSVEKVESIPFKGYVEYDVRVNFRNKKEEPVAAMYIVNPLDPAEADLEVQIRNKSRRGRFDIMARRLLADKPKLKINGTMRLGSFISSKTRSTEGYCILEMNSLFDDGTESLIVPDEIRRAGLLMLAKEKLIPTAKKNNSLDDDEDDDE